MQPKPFILVIVIGAILLTIPFIWAMTEELETGYQEQMGRLPLIVMANSGAMLLASCYSLIIFCIYKRWKWLSASIAGFVLTPILLFFAFFLVGFLLGIIFLPLPWILVIITAVVASSTRENNKPNKAQHPTTSPPNY